MSYIDTYSKAEIDEKLSHLRRKINFALFQLNNGGGGLPDPTGHNGDFLTTDGTVLSWGAGGGGGTTIYTGDGSLAGDRTVDLDGHNLVFHDGGGEEPFKLNRTVGSESSTLVGKDGIGTSYLDLESNVNSGYVFYLVSYNGTNTIRIEGDAVANSLEYTADTHTFNGEVNIGGDAILGGTPVPSMFSVNTGTLNWFFIGSTGFGNIVLIGDVVSNPVDSVSVSANDTITLFTTTTNITLDEAALKITLSATHLNYPGRQEFANNAAAVTGGLLSGDIYYTNVAGEGILKVVI